MFKAIANWFNQAAQVLELEKALSEEQNFCDGVLKKTRDYLDRTNAAERELLELQQKLAANETSLMLSDSYYRSLLRDWVNQREQIAKLKQELSETRLKLARVTYNSSGESKVYLVVPVPKSN